QPRSLEPSAGLLGADRVGPDRQTVTDRVVRADTAGRVAGHRDAGGEDHDGRLVEDVVSMRRESQPVVAAHETEVPYIGVAGPREFGEWQPRLETIALDRDRRRPLGFVVPAHGCEPEAPVRDRQ